MSEAAQHASQSGWEVPVVTPFGVSWNKVMMWLFIVTDGLLFAGFLAGYGLSRVSSPHWPQQLEIFHLRQIALMTFILISSSATMAVAVRAASDGARSVVGRYLLATIVGGSFFLGMQAYEWSQFIAEGARLDANPWGPAQFSSYFFIITGLHGTHVLTGIIILTIVARRWTRGRSSAEGVELAGLYWHFVDLVWVFIFTLFYLI